MEPAETNRSIESNIESAAGFLSVCPARVLFAVPQIEERVEWLALLTMLGHVPKCIDSYENACAALARDDFHLIIIHPDFDDGRGMKLARHISRCRLRAKMVLVSEQSSFEIAVDALRLGVADVLSMPFPVQTFRYSIENALMKSREERLQRDRIHRLREMCRKLSTAREESSREVDLLCRDLATAYEDIADQMNEVAMVSEFRTLLAQELDIENLLRTTLEYMLTKTGPTNAAVFLPDPEEGYALGAYVNWNFPRDSAEGALERLAACCPMLDEESEVLFFEDGVEFSEWTGEAIEALHGNQVIAFRCTQNDETLALMILFRDAKEPFRNELPSTLDALRTVFAKQVSNVIRIHRRARPQWPVEPAEDCWDVDDDFGFAA